MLGCLEHTRVLIKLLREARKNKGDLVELGLDLANAYGSVPHKLVEEALRRHHIPNIMSNLIRDCYNDFKSYIMNYPIRMAQTRKRHYNWLYIIFSTLLLSPGYACQRVKSPASTYKGIYG